MNFTQLNTENSKEWDRFCLQSDDAWFWHSTVALDYSLQLRPQLDSVSLSFVVSEGSQILSVCPLILETYRQGGLEVREFSSGGVFGVCPVFDTELSEIRRHKIAKVVFGNIDSLAAQNEVQRISIMCSPLAPSFMGSVMPPPNWLLRHGFQDVSLTTQIIDLSQNLQSLWGDMRKGHRQDIERGRQSLNVTSFDQDNVTLELFNEYRFMHQKAAGRITRPLITFEMMYEWIVEGYAVLFGASLDDRFVGWALINTYKEGAYFSSACNDPEFSSLPISHVLQWDIIEWLKDAGYRFYELGYQQYSSLPYDFPTEKEINIAFHKRGFGGRAVPLFRGEKYYSREHYLQTAQSRIEKFAATVPDITCHISEGSGKDPLLD